MQVPELGASVFIIPTHQIKNREDSLVVHNRIASAAVNEMRGVHSEYVFTHKGKRLSRKYSWAWRKDRIRAN